MDSNRRGTSKFTCYFCNKTIENDTEMGHTAVCGNVLVPCPNKCGSYVPRMDLKKHKRECLNRISTSTLRLPTLNENRNLSYDTLNSPTSTNSLERFHNGYARVDPRLQEELVKLSKKLVNMEQRLSQQSLQNSTSQDARQYFDSMKNTYMQLSLEIEKLKYQSKATFDWKKNFESQLDNMKRFASLMQNSKKESDMHWMGLNEKIIVLEKVQTDLGYLRDLFFKEQAYNRQVDSNFERDLDTFKAHFSQENVTFAAFLNDQKVAIDNLRSDIGIIKNMYEGQKAKFTNIIFDLRAASQIASEAAEKLEIHEREFADTKKEISQMKLDIEILEGLASTNDTNIKPGRLIWKITQVESKLQKAKDFGSVLKSSIFYTEEYGYKIKILMYMNGLKKWKDRYALLCIHVLKGDYDMLLKWPCHIEGNITLRNLEDLDKAKPFSKYITAKRQCGDEESEEPQESSSSYIFIPHSTLLKDQYVKEDTLFLDIKIQQNNKLETSL